MQMDGRRGRPRRLSQRKNTTTEESTKKRQCKQCQALSETSGERCRNLAQCHVEFTMGSATDLCNIHVAQIKRYGPQAVRLVADTARETRFEREQRAVASIKQLTRIEEEQQEQRQQLASIVALLRRLEQRQPALQASASVKQPQEPAQTQKQEQEQPQQQPQKQQQRPQQGPKKTSEPPRARAKPSKSEARQLGALLSDLVATARLVHAEIGSTQSLAAALCSNVSADKIEQSIEPMLVLRTQLDELLVSVRNSIIEADFGAIERQRARFRQFSGEFERASVNSRRRLEKECKSSKFTIRPSLKFALDLASGAVTCNGESIPQALRNWYLVGSAASGAAEPTEWQNRRLLCNVRAQPSGGGANQLEAFRKGQALRKNYTVYDVRDQVIAFGQKTSKKKEEEQKKGEQIPVGLGEDIARAERLSDAERMLRKHLSWLSTLSLLIEMYAVAGMDSSALAYEKLSVSVALGNLALTVGRGRATRYMSAQQYNTVTQLAELSGTYATYLGQPEGAIGLATLAAYATNERLKDNAAVDEPTRRRAVRMTYARAITALTLLGGGLFAYLRWHATAAAPRTLHKNAPAGASDVPVLETGAEAKELLQLGNSSVQSLPPLPNAFGAQPQTLPAADAKQRDFARLLDQMRSPEEQTRLIARQMKASARASIVSGVGETPDTLMTAFYPQLTTPGGRLFPMTRQQFERTQISSPMTLIDPASLEIAQLFRTTLQKLSTVRPGLARRLAQQASTPLPSGPERRAAASLPTVGESGAALPPQVAPLPPGLQPQLQPQSPVLGLASGAGTSAQSVFRPDITSAGLDAGASLFGLLGLLPQIVGGAAPVQVSFPPELNSALFNLNRAAQRSAESGESPLERPSIFQSGETVADATRSGMTSIRTYQLLAQNPGMTARQDAPDETAALLSAIRAARRSVNETELLFDDAVAPDFDDAIDHIAEQRIFAAAQSPVQFLKALSGTTPGGMTGSDVARLQRRLALMEMGISNTTAIDLHLDEAFQRFNAIGNPARAMAADVELLVRLTLDLGYTAAQYGAERFGSAAEAVGQSAGRAARLAERALKSRSVRSLLDAPASLHGFLVGIAEKDMQQTLAELEQSSMLERAILSALHTVSDMSIAGASIASRHISAALQTLGEREVANIGTSDEFDRLLASQFDTVLQVGAQKSRELAKATAASLQKVPEAGAQLSQKTRAEVARFQTRAANQIRAQRETVASYLKSTATARGAQLKRLSQDFLAKSRRWSREVLLNAERAAAKQMEIERASQQVAREQIALLEQTLERALDKYARKVAKLVNDFVEGRAESKRAAMRQRTAIEQKLERLAAKLSLDSARALEQISRQLAVQEETVLRLQREALFANIVGQAKRDAAEQEFRQRIQRERQRYAKAAVTGGAEQVAAQLDQRQTKQSLGRETASENVAKISVDTTTTATTSVHYRQFEQELKQISVADEMVADSEKIARDYQEATAGAKADAPIEDIAQRLAEAQIDASRGEGQTWASWWQRGVKSANDQVSMRACMAGLPLDAPGWKKAIAYYGVRPSVMLDEQKISTCASALNLSAKALEHYRSMAKLEQPAPPAQAESDVDVFGGQVAQQQFTSAAPIQQQPPQQRAAGTQAAQTRIGVKL